MCGGVDRRRGGAVAIGAIGTIVLSTSSSSAVGAEEEELGTVGGLTNNRGVGAVVLVKLLGLGLGLGLGGGLDREAGATASRA